MVWPKVHGGGGRLRADGGLHDRHVGQPAADHLGAGREWFDGYDAAAESLGELGVLASVRADVEHEHAAGDELAEEVEPRLAPRGTAWPSDVGDGRSGRKVELR